MEKLSLNYVEFYITNVCNLNCTDCNRFNNYYFKGFQRWNDYKHIYKQWSKKLNIQQIAILGGEPTLNPTLNEWVYGISELWPMSYLSIVTNGTRFNHLNGLYKILLEHKGKITIEVSIHNNNMLHDLINNTKQFLSEPILEQEVILDKDFYIWNSIYNDIKSEQWPKCTTPDDFHNLPTIIQKECDEIFDFSYNKYMKRFNTIEFIDKNNIKVLFIPGVYFNNSSLKLNGNTFDTYNSIPQQAHDICYSNTCHHFIKGKLYQCPLVGILPEFINQFDVNITTNDLNLLNQYTPLAINDDMSTMKTFIANIGNVIPQCKLCPSTFNMTKINASTDKLKIKKK